LQSWLEVHGGRHDGPPSSVWAPAPVLQTMPPLKSTQSFLLEHDPARTQILAGLIGP
jgi:hypothetical protein